jgi:thiol-disulfide isomerase/thioredoxin
MIAEPVHALGKAVVISGHLAGADVKVFRYQALSGKLEQLWQGHAPQTDLFNVPVSQLTTNDKVFAVQQYQLGGQLLTSADPPPKLLTAAFPPVPLLAPYLNTPLYACARAIRVGNIVNGATVEVYRNGQRIFEGAIGYPNMEIVGIDPLKPDDELYAVQYFPDIKPATSGKERVKPYPEQRLPKPAIKKPLIECAPSFEVEGLVPGARLFVHEQKSGALIAERVVSEPVASVHLKKGGLRNDWTLVASQQLCEEKDRSPDSDAVPVEDIGNFAAYPPRFVAKVKPGDTFVVVEGVHESTIRILADGSDIGGGTCYGITAFALDAPLPKAQIQLIQSLDCHGKVWEVKSPPVSSVPDDEVVELNEETFSSTINTASLPIMVEFWSPACHVCVAIAPTISQLAKDYAGRVIIAKLDVVLYDPYSDPLVPTFRFYTKGNVVATVVGWDEWTVRQLLDQLAAP